MAVLSVKSSSPSPSPNPGRANPSARNSEIGNSMRRSFSGNPFGKPSIVPNPRGLNPNTPANSPAENQRWNSVSREIDDKENSKAAKIRSPMSGSKGMKNFMSPTISAASKITPSPRKRILEERNETVRSSVTFPELKTPSFGEEETLVSLKAEQTINAKEEFPLNSEAEPELVNHDHSHKMSPPSAPVIAPLDSDPSAPPYDPKTNYLSPRPRFLHYKPNPRVELYLNQGREGKRLEDSFVFESFSDTDATEEGTTQSDGSPKESEDDVSSSEEAKAEEKEQEQDQEEDELVVSESNPISAPMKEEIVEAKSASKRRSVWRSKLTALLIVLSIACISLSVANLPVVDHSVFDSSSNFFKDYDHSEMLAFGKARLDGLVQNLGIWYENSVTFASDLGSYLRGPHESLHYYNLTDLFEDVRIDGYDVNVFVMATREKEIDVNVNVFVDEYDEEIQEGQEAETSFDVEEVTPENQIITSPVSEQVVGVPKAELVNLKSGLSGGDFEPDSAPTVEEVSEVPKAELVEQESSPSEGQFEANQALVSQADEVSEVDLSSTTAEIEPAKVADLSSEPRMFDAPSEEDAKTSEEVAFAADGSKDNLSKVKVLGITLLVVLAGIGSVAFIAMKRGNNGLTLDAKSTVVAKKLDISPEKNNLEVKQHSSWNYTGDYCPSEMSSSYENNTTYYSKKGESKTGLNEEAQSYERSQKKKGQRRESMASSSMDSSMGSPSYGSFTTYEKISTKMGYGDDITPVRRSSRLRSQVTSPS